MIACQVGVTYLQLGFMFGNSVKLPSAQKDIINCPYQYPPCTTNENIPFCLRLKYANILNSKWQLESKYCDARHQLKVMTHL